jgi:hypothetical protein
MAILALEYRVHGDGAGRDEEERSGERNWYRGAVEWMKVEVSWDRLLRGHSRGRLAAVQCAASSPASPERSRVVSLVTSFGS